ncbi:cytidine deaminase [Photorhabdus akhurstii]|uniref:cytidine deaminase n=1 Tax=Photorhabdus akhurstii TaxID=171438 RepID=UPI000D4A36AF|nr:cytidine deaminase [Photorhabdus luminescens]
MVSNNENVVLKEQDVSLIEAARAAIISRYKPDWHVVGAALRLRSGEIVTGVHLEANVGRIAVCAEAIAIGRAVTEYGSADIDTVVAVYHSRDGAINIVSPCGMCRELISDYAPQAMVLIQDEELNCVKRPIMDLLPVKYQRNITTNCEPE